MAAQKDGYTIRRMKESEYPLLEDFLYEAIFIPEGMDAPPRSILQSPELQVYVADFGRRRDDLALVAEADGKVVGAVWTRIMNDYGHIDEQTPSLAISLYRAYRGLGIGTDLMKRMLEALKEKGCEKVSLSVQKANYAVNMYQKTGFEIIGERGEEYLMVHDFSSNGIREGKGTLFHELDEALCGQLIQETKHCDYTKVLEQRRKNES